VCLDGDTARGGGRWGVLARLGRACRFTREDDRAVLLPLAGAESAARLTLGGRHDRGGHKLVIGDMPHQAQISDGRASGGGGGCAIGSGSLRWEMASGGV